MRRKIISLAVAIAVNAVAPAHALDLLGAYESALSNDPTFKVAIKDNEAGQSNRIIGRSQLMPRVSYSYWTAANDMKQSGAAYTGGPSQTFSQAYPSQNQTLQMNQPIFNLQALAQYRQAMAQGDFSEAKFVFSSQELIVRVVQAYTDVLYAEDVLEFLRAQEKAFAEQLKVNQGLFKKGEGTRTDTLETLASYESSKAQVIEAENQLENSRQKLEAIIGERLASVTNVRKMRGVFKTQPISPIGFEHWRDIALSNNSELRAQQHQVEVARQNYMQNKAAHYPTIGAVASWNKQNSYTVNTVNNFTEQTLIGVQVNVPIFSGGETVGKTSQARSQFEKEQAAFDVTRDRVVTELRKQYDAVITGEKKILALNRAVDSASELTYAMRQSIRGGVRINVDALLADKGLASVQKDLAQAKYNYLLAVLRFKQQAGTLTVEDIEKTAAYFARDGKGGA